MGQAFTNPRLRHAAMAMTLMLGLGAGGFASATPTLDGDSVTVEYFDDLGFPAETDTVTVGAGAEISYFDGTNIGDLILLDNESIDLGGLTIRYNVQGGGDDYPGNPAYQTIGLGPNAYMEFTGLDISDVLAPPGTLFAISGVTIDLVDVIGVTAGDVTFTDDSVRLFLGDDVGVLATSDVGAINLELSLRITLPEQNGDVPAPTSLALLGLALTSLGLWRRRRDG